MSQEEVKKAENGDPDPKLSDGNSLFYKSEVLGEKALIIYTFAFNKLVRAKYMLAKYRSPDEQKLLFAVIPPQKPIAGEWIYDFFKFEKALKEKYGEPEKRHIVHPKEMDENTSDRDMGKAIEIMEKALRNDDKFGWSSLWKTKNTMIILILHSKGGRIIFEIGYSSIKLKNVEKEDSF
jgi:hypothetical protein